MDTSAAPERGSLTPQLVIGLLIIVVGVLFTLDNLGIAYAEDYLRFWPVGLIAIGLAKLWQGRGSAGSFAGGLFVLIGLLLLADSLGVVRVSIGQLWPLALVFFGASMVWRGVHGRATPASGDSTATVSGIAILGGVKRGNNSRAFKGGDLTAVMGGCEIDLRQAAIDGEATIEVFAMWGGIELRVPEDWTVISRVVPLLGGVEDKTRPPQGAATHRLVLRGFAIMGGVEVKN